MADSRLTEEQLANDLDSMVHRASPYNIARLACLRVKGHIEALKTERDVLVKTLAIARKEHQEHEGWQIDWATFSSHSPDYDKDYKPTFSALTQDMDAALAALVAKEPDSKKEPTKEAFELHEELGGDGH